MWNGSSEAVTDQTSRNYMYGDKVFILDTITTENCAFLIGDLTTFIFNPNNAGNTITFIINSPGGEAYVMMNILGLMNLARLHNITIDTFVLGEAGSAASLIAVSGDNRYMSRIAKHFIHFGSIVDLTQKHSEIEKIYLQNKEYADNLDTLYLEASKGKLSKQKLLEIESDERGYLNADLCLKYGLADIILEDDLIAKRNYEKAKNDFEANFSKLMDVKEKSANTNKKPAKKK